MKTPLASIFLVAFATAASAQEPAAEPSASPPSEPAADPAEAAPAPSDEEAAPPPEPTSPTRLAPIDTPTPVDPGAPFAAAAEARYGECNALLERGETEAARACYLDVAVKARGTEAALKADAALFVLDAKLTPPEAPAGIIPAGRLGITTAVGLFGVMNAIAGGVIVANTVPTFAGTPLVLATGVAAVGLGIGGGVGGYFLADALKLDEGAARLVASSLVWGTAIGGGLSLSVAALINGPTGQNYVAATDAAIATILLGGYAVGGAALLLTANVKFDEAQVGLINSGGLVGSVVGLLILPNLATAGVSSTPVYSAVYVGSTAAGLLAGAALGRTLDTTWGEVLVCDLAGVLGLVGGGAVGLAIASSTGATAAPALGLIAGYGAGLGVVTTWRKSRGAPIWRDAPAIRPTALSLVDSTGHAVAGIGIRGEI